MTKTTINDDNDDDHKKMRRSSLFEYTEEELLEDGCLTHYEILGLPVHASTEQVKKAYRRTSLKYHPDKTGRGQDDYVFLAVKAAYDTLYDHNKRQAYDSTVLPFDDSIPPPRSQLIQQDAVASGGSYTDDDFYDVFRPVFERNLRFDARLRPDSVNGTNGGGSGSNGTNSNKSKKQRQSDAEYCKRGPPELGDDGTPVELVHAFYEYWIHFESWRDFTGQAADELKLSQEMENAESRYEKRWYQQQVEKRAKQCKKQEMVRVQTLVERAMEADPRLRRERQAAAEAKERAKRDKAAAVEAQRAEARRRADEEAAAAEAEKQRLAAEKVEREKQKKRTRKARQSLRKLANATFEGTDTADADAAKGPVHEQEDASSSIIWKDAYDMNQDVDFLCSLLDVGQLQQLTADLNELDGSRLETLRALQRRVREERQKQQEREREEEQMSASRQQKEAAQRKQQQQAKQAWTSEELSALAKGVKKFPAGGSSRWEQICAHVNNLCRPAIPRTKEECIEKYNQVVKQQFSNAKPTTATTTTTTTTTNTVQSKQQVNGAAAAAAAAAGRATATKESQQSNGRAASAADAAASEPAAKSDAAAATTTTTKDGNSGAASSATSTKTITDNGGGGGWTTEQDAQLQAALAQYPVSMDTNARWTKIAQAVTGKTKKQCVGRFKAIRQALQQQKQQLKQQKGGGSS